MIEEPEFFFVPLTPIAVCVAKPVFDLPVAEGPPMISADVIVALTVGILIPLLKAEQYYSYRATASLAHEVQVIGSMVELDQ